MVSDLEKEIDYDQLLTLLTVCYPPHGLGPSGVRAILSFFEDDDDANKLG